MRARGYTRHIYLAHPDNRSAAASFSVKKAIRLQLYVTMRERVRDIEVYGMF